VLNAFREISDSLVSREQLIDVHQHQANEVSALQSAVKLSTERYVAGKADYYEVLEAQPRLATSRPTRVQDYAFMEVQGGPVEATNRPEGDVASRICSPTSKSASVWIPQKEYWDVSHSRDPGIRLKPN
jgi:hypothetical protein